MIMGLKRKPAQSRKAPPQGHTAGKSQSWDLTLVCILSLHSYPTGKPCFFWELLLLGAPGPKGATSPASQDHQQPL